MEQGAEVRRKAVGFLAVLLVAALLLLFTGCRAENNERSGKETAGGTGYGWKAWRSILMQ